MRTTETNCRAEYRRFSNDEPDVPLFSKAWWLDAVAPGQWSAVMAFQGPRITGALPYVLRRRYGVTYTSQPALTQTLGPWSAYARRRSPKDISRHVAVLEALESGLPKLDYYSQNWHHSQNNWLPFYWRGYRQTTRYTYRLQHTCDPEAYWRGMRDKTRNEVRKARDKMGMAVEAGSLADLLRLNQKVFARQNLKVPYTHEVVHRVASAAEQRGALDLLLVRDSSGTPHASLMIVSDARTAYYLIGASDPALRSSGALSLGLWVAIDRARSRGLDFDFEGSMMPNVEPFIRGFGGTLTPYFSIRRANTRKGAIAHQLRGAQ